MKIALLRSDLPKVGVSWTIETDVLEGMSIEDLEEYEKTMIDKGKAAILDLLVQQNSWTLDIQRT